MAEERPPAPGYAQHLNRAAYEVTEDRPEGPITVRPAIAQAGGRWRLEGGQWLAEAEA